MLFRSDAHKTQEAKINQLNKRNIKVNPNIIFIPIDFSKESLKDKLIEFGFKKDQKSLFILEGLTMYLSREAVESTFRIIDEFSANGSKIVFDYIYLSVLKKENNFYGEKQIYNIVRNVNEEWCFGFDKEEAKPFLKIYNFNLVENLSSDDLEGKYFQNIKGRTGGKINGTHCIAYAKKQHSIQRPFCLIAKI